MLTAFALALLAAPVRGQDDNGAPPPPPDNGAPPAMDNGDNGAPAPDDANGAPDDNASFQTFYDSLGSQGTWIQSSDYGYVWQPDVNDPDWAPYTEGHWVYTDDGWTWVSDEPWGWATYHYGRWVNLNGTGWCWVPGYTWAPAWVSWRYGGGYCGWAPLPPDSFVGIDYSDDGFAIGIGFHIGGDCDGFYGIGPGCYIFLPVNCLGYRSYHGYYHNRGDNFAIINHTTNVTNINVTRNGANSGVTIGGPMLAQVNAVSQTPVETVRLVRASQPGGGGTLTANSLALYAPHVNPGTPVQPSRVMGSIKQATINHGADITRPLAVNSRLAPAPATEAQVQQARIAQDQSPAGAKVVTDSATVNPVLQAPLTSLKPMARQVIVPPTPGASSGTISTTERVPSASGIAPTVKVYPQPGEPGGIPSHVYQPETVHPSGPSSYQPHPSATGTGGGGSESRSYVRPEPPAPSSSAPPGIQQGTGGGSGGGGGSSHGGGANGGNYQQQGQGQGQGQGH